MIEYDYLLERDMGEAGIVKLSPKVIPTEISNLVRIEGPNGIGKSTLLNIIALGFWGTDSRKIHPSLLEKMASLTSSDYQGLKFSVKITSGRETLILTSTKPARDNQEIIVQESIDGVHFKPISRERFDEKYNLIYDIASNPIARLYDLLKDLREEERSIGCRFKEFASDLRTILKDIDNSRNLERLEQVRQNIDKIKQENLELVSAIPNLASSFDLLEKHAYLQLYYHNLNEYNTLRAEKQEFENNNQDIESNNKKVGKQLLKCSKEIEDLRKKLLNNYQEASPLIKGTLPDAQKIDLKIWKTMNPYSTDENDLNALHDEAFHLHNILSVEFENIKSQNAFQDAAVLEGLIQALKGFENSPLMIPKLSVTIADLINILKEDNEKNFVLMSKYRNIQSVLNMLTDLGEESSELLLKLEETKGISQDRKKTTEAIATILSRKNELKGMQESLSNYLKKIDFYYNKCLSKNFDGSKLKMLPYKDLSQGLPSNKDLEYFLTLTEEQINHRIAELYADLKRRRTKKEENDTVLGIFESELADLEKQQPHELEAYKSEITSLMNKANAVSQKLLANYDLNIVNLIEKKVDKKAVERDPSKRKHYDEISHYLAHRIGVFPHMDKKYRAVEVDLISGIILTEDKAIIHVNDIGTGHSQSTYLCSLLNVADDGRKIIALFDEIAMMDDKSLEPLCNKIVSLNEANRLLVGILVQRSEQFQMKALK